MAFKIADMFIRIFVRKDNVDAEIDQTKAKLDEAAESGNRGGSRIAGGFQRAGDAASKLQATLGRILIPVAVVTAVKAITDQITASIDRAREFQAALDSLARSASARTAEIAQRRSATDLTEQLRAIRQASAAEQDAALRQFEADAKRLDSIFGNLKANFISLFSDAPQTLSQLRKAFEDATASIERDEIQQTRLILRQAEQARRESLARRLRESREAIALEREAETKALEEALQAEERAFETRIDRINREAEERTKALRELLTVTTLTEEGRSNAENLLKRVEESRRRQIEEENRASQQQAQVMSDTLRKAFEEGARKMREEIEQALSSQSGVFGSGTASLERLMRQLVTEQRVGRG